MPTYKSPELLTLNVMVLMRLLNKKTVTRERKNLVSFVVPQNYIPVVRKGKMIKSAYKPSRPSGQRSSWFL